MKGAAHIEPMHAMAMAEHAELRKQVQRLSTQCTGLSEQVEELITLLEARSESAGATSSAGSDNQALDAAQEQLLREIMRTDGISRKAALEVIHRMGEHNSHWNWLYSAPYYFGIGAAFVAAVGSTCLVFNGPIVALYASKVAGEDLPEGVEDVNELTLNQVGAWSWTWVEPMIGTASFVLLCMQFARAQARRMDFTCYKQLITGWRAQTKVKAFPQYNKNVIGAWAKQLPPVKWTLPSALKVKDSEFATIAWKQGRMSATELPYVGQSSHKA
eukprot:CAMPEP_0172700428 /NCGR_PEP_ID=MMETSP1074-20121228/30899_1 /TAXON_ID=2916 /ORGANISM="Ceratium fusus, Strain PA161109" /LENGTH=272 /DNA_ID=CAMNT_0013521797 /DNA_START=174 /DNA_END=992 /DNA_ORIENTATION=-